MISTPCASPLPPALVAALVYLAGCSEADTCLECDPATRAGTVAAPELAEVSGVVASSRLEDVLYVHNDSSDSSRLFAVGLDGKDLGTFNVDDAANEDWEDIARGPCDAGTCLYVADIGDNTMQRASYAIYIVPEPDAVGPGEHMLTSERISFAYDGGRHDAEVLLVHPQTGAITVVTKAENGPASIYELPLPLVPDLPYAATKAGEIEPSVGSSRFTGGAIHPDATGILLRTKSRLFHYPMAPGQTAAEALTAEGCALELADETQGEAVTWLGQGERIVTMGEGVYAGINIADCRPG
jgi:hypothetical protein